jgi:hypothetical protein
LAAQRRTRYLMAQQKQQQESDVLPSGPISERNNNLPRNQGSALSI